MATYGCVMFGHILYDDKLTWQELIETEARVTRLMQSALEEVGARHIDFIAQGDALLVECVFPEVNRETNQALCNAVIRDLGASVLARFMFVDRQMDSTVFYFLGRGKWQEQALSVPGPKEALSGWVVRQERKTSERVIPAGMPARTRKRVLTTEIPAENEVDLPEQNGVLLTEVDVADVQSIQKEVAVAMALSPKKNKKSSKIAR